MTKLIQNLIALALLSEPLMAQIEEHKVKPFLQEYCVSCHGEQKEKGDIRLDQFEQMDSEKWQLVYEQLYHEEMPPSKKPQPADDVREELMAYLLEHANDGEDAEQSLSTGYRKLNQREYSYTVRDLLGIKYGDFDPGDFVYKDIVEKGFDTEAESLVMSSELLLEYLSAAEKSVNQALFTEDYNQPESSLVKVNLNRALGRRSKKTKKHLMLRTVREQLYSSTDNIELSGNYKVTIEAEPVDEFINYNGTQREAAREMNLGVGGLNPHSEFATRGVVRKRFLIESGQKTYSETLWLEKGYVPFISYADGPKNIPTLVRRNKNSKHLIDGKVVISAIKVTGFKVEGPLVGEWPPESFKTTYSQEDVPDLTSVEQRGDILRNFLTRAYRRTPTEDEVKTYDESLAREFGKTNSWHQAMVKVFATIMVSPDFLYIKTSQGGLTDFELASRLSYFFWSSMPDEELFALAEKGQLSDPKVYAEQVSRMFEDPKTHRFMNSFVSQWLSLDKLGTMPPDDRGPYKYYYSIADAIEQETVSYFKYVLLKNRSINEFIDSNYSFLNKGLANLYKVPFEGNSTALEKVTLPKRSRRGGIITHASILSLTSNGVETTPIERGHWILDELMGTPPPPPPKEVAAISADLRGIKTIRDQLIKHRSDPNCIQCHLKMDPPGFALEAFDPIGRHRLSYDKNNRVETGGTFLGSNFKDVRGLKKILLNNNHLIARNLVVKLAEYAKGRKLSLSDLKVVQQVVDDSAESDYAFRTMLEHMLNSDLMRQQ